MTTAALLAAAAVALLAWRRGTSAALPPLEPAAPAMPAGPARPGPDPWTLAAIVAAGAMVAVAIASRPGPAPGPAPMPAPAGLDLRGAFRGAQAAADALTVAELLDGLADAIETDGAKPEPRLRSGQQLAELRATAREYRTDGAKLGDRQPAARDAIAAFLESQVGTDGGPVDAAGRARWVSAFRSVAAAAKAAAGR